MEAKQELHLLSESMQHQADPPSSPARQPKKVATKIEMAVVTFFVLLLSFISIGSHQHHIFVTAASTEDEKVCAADDPRQECNGPEADVDSEDSEYYSDDDDDEIGCADDERECKYWSGIGECENNPGYMLEHCRLSCNACGSDYE